MSTTGHSSHEHSVDDGRRVLARVPEQRKTRHPELLGGLADEYLPTVLWTDVRVRLLVCGWLSGF